MLRERPRPEGRTSGRPLSRSGRRMPGIGVGRAGADPTNGVPVAIPHDGERVVWNDVIAGC